jgi:hypothetical protein
LSLRDARFGLDVELRLSHGSCVPRRVPRYPVTGPIHGGVAVSGEKIWRAVATFDVGTRASGPFELDVDAPVTIGRSERCGLRSTDERVPRELASLRITDEGWILENERQTVKGRIAPMRVSGRFIATRGGALLAPRAMILLQRGDWQIEWDLAVKIVLSITPLLHDGIVHPVARDKRFGEHGIGTLAPRRLWLTDDQRTRMAALYAPLIRGGERAIKPRYGVAADLAGCTSDQLKSTYQNVKRKVNVGRDSDAQITGFEELGYHLIDVEGVIGNDDLPD